MSAEAPKAWWHKEGVQIIREAHAISLSDHTILKPESRWRVRDSELSHTSFGLFLRVYGQSHEVSACRPDLEDPGTLGFLLAHLRETRGMCSSFKTAKGWRCYSASGALWGEGDSEAEALLGALETSINER